MSERVKKWIKHEAKRQSYARNMRKALEKALNEDIFSKIGSLDIEEVIEIFKLNKGINKTFDEIVLLYQKISANFANDEYSIHKSYTFVKKDELGAIWENNVDGYIERISERKLIQLNQTTANQISRQVQRARQQGLGVAEAMDFINKNMRNISRTRAATIFRTESVAAANFGSKSGAYATGLQLSERWLSTPDSRTRDGEYDHVNADGTEATESGYFTVSGEKMEFPGDTSHGASAGNVINCRCTNIFE